jgi:hypothetical protein
VGRYPEPWVDPQQDHPQPLELVAASGRITGVERSLVIDGQGSPPPAITPTWISAAIAAH